MGGSVSKSTIKGNQKTLDDMDLTLSKLLTETLNKYSEFVEKETNAYHAQIIENFEKKSTSLPVKPPSTNIKDVFKAKCNKDVVVIIKKKLNKFPKWALQERGFLFTSMKEVPLAIQDTNNMNKDEMCTKMAQLYTALLFSIELAITSLFTCREGILQLHSRLNAPFTSVSGATKDPVGDSPANEEWFKAMNEYQKMYKKRANEAKKLFNSLKGKSTLSKEQVDKFINKLDALNRKLNTMPQQCKILYESVDRQETISQATADTCKKLKIKAKACNQSTIELKKMEQDALNKMKVAAQATKNPVAAAKSAAAVVPDTITSIIRKR